MSGSNLFCIFTTARAYLGVIKRTAQLTYMPQYSSETRFIIAGVALRCCCCGFSEFRSFLFWSVNGASVCHRCDSRTTVTRTTATYDNCYPGQLPPSRIATQDNCHPGQLPHRTTATQDNCHSEQLPPRTTATQGNCHLVQLPPRTTATQDNCDPEQLPPSTTAIQETVTLCKCYPEQLPPRTIAT